jgi:hypothetical protein
MQGVTPGASGGPDDRAGVEIGGGARPRQVHRGVRPRHVGAGGVVVRVDRDGVDAEHGRGGHDAHRDLRPIRDEQLHVFLWLRASATYFTQAAIASIALETGAG